MTEYYKPGKTTHPKEIGASEVARQLLGNPDTSGRGGERGPAIRSSITGNSKLGVKKENTG